MLYRSTPHPGKRTEWLVVCALLLVFAGLVFGALSYERSRIVREQEHRLTTEARVIEENIVRQLEGVSNGLQSILQDRHSFEEDPGASTVRLQGLSNAMPGARTLLLFDAQASVIASNRRELLYRNFSGRDYYPLVMQSPDPSALYLSKPFKTVLGVYSMNLLRVSTNAQGNVERIASATLDPDFFKTLLSSVRFADDVWVSLAHIDGQLALHLPEEPVILGQSLKKPGSLFSQHIEGRASTSLLQGIDQPTGEEAWVAQRTITAPSLNLHGALLVAVGRQPEAALAQWYQLTAIGSGLVLLVCASALLALRHVHRHQDEILKVLAHEEALRSKAEEEVRRLAFYDELTQLPNRRLLRNRLAQVLAASVRHGRHSALFFMDLDGFKALNDTHGHEKGDRLLQSVGQRLQAQIRQEDTVARWAGDEFVVVLSEVGGDAATAQQNAGQVAEKILASLAQVHDLDTLPFHCTASLGITTFGAKNEPLDEIIHRADQAMYAAKAAGKNTYRSTELA